MVSQQIWQCQDMVPQRKNSFFELELPSFLGAENQIMKRVAKNQLLDLGA